MAGARRGLARRLGWPSRSGWRTRLAARAAAGDVRVDRADRRHHLPQPLLVPDPGGRAGGGRAARRGGEPRRPPGRRPAPRSPAGGCGCCGSRSAWSTCSPGWPSCRATGSCRALPLRLWLPARADLPLVGPLLVEPATAHVLAVAGAVFDCAIVPLLLWRRTRPCRRGSCSSPSTSTTWALFPIGVFPWLMIGAGHRVLRARLAHAAPRGSSRPRPRDAVVDMPRRARRRRSTVAGWLLGRGAAAVGRRAARPAAAAPRLPGRPPLDGPGLPLRLERAAHREGRLGDLPRPRPATGRRGRPTRRALHADPAAGDGGRARPHPPGRPRHRRRRAPSAAATSRCGSTRGCRSTAARRPASSTPTVDLAAQPRDPWPDDWILPARTQPVTKPVRNDGFHRPVRGLGAVRRRRAASDARVIDCRVKWPTMRWRAEPLGWQPKSVAV